MALSGLVLCTVTVEEAEQWAEQVIIGNERNIGDGRCPGWGRGGGGAAVPAGDPVLPQSVIRLDRNRNCPRLHRLMVACGAVRAVAMAAPLTSAPPPPRPRHLCPYLQLFSIYHFDSGFGYI